MESVSARLSAVRGSYPAVMQSAPFLLFMPSGGEWLVIVFTILLLFGGKKIPELLRGFGRGIREFNEARDNVRDSLHNSVRQAEKETRQQQSAANTNNQPPQPVG